jgi:hypothetical protein
MQAIVIHKATHKNITQVHIPLYFFGGLEGISNKTSTIHQF